MSKRISRFAAGLFVLMIPVTASLHAEEGAGSYEKSKATLKELIFQAQENIRKVDQIIDQRERERRNEARESKARESFERGNALYSSGDLEGATKAWKEALDISGNPEMKGHIAEQARQAREKAARAEAERLSAEKAAREKLEQEAAALKHRIDATYEEGVALYRQEKCDAAEAKFAEVLSLDPANAGADRYVKSKLPDLRRELAKREEDAARKREAERQKELAAAEKERQARDAFARGNDLFAKGELKAARAAWEEAIAITGDTGLQHQLRELERQAENASPVPKPTPVLKAEELPPAVSEAPSAKVAPVKPATEVLSSPKPAVDPAPVSKAVSEPSPAQRPSPAPVARPLPVAAQQGGEEVAASSCIITRTIDLKARKPGETLANATTGDAKLYCFTELNGVKGERVTHVWEHDGKVVSRFPLGKIRSSSWRIWSRKWMEPELTGTWTVKVVTGAGRVLAVQNFEYVSQ
ncbi:MAG: DUF2914 domain-containing protein [Chlorobiaceae bacterium]|nr:DUF2914 domain-containing protein [Chlorobiaceae bacterium]